jgi:glycosyltransferase involved in cell wall biosynthesis
MLVRHPARYVTFLLRVAAFRKEMGSKPELVPWWRLPAVAERLDADVVHSHFGWSGATTAALLGALLGVPWSMTLHAKDIFTKRRGIERKLASADLVVTVCEYNRDYIETEFDAWVPNLEVLTCGVVPPPGGRRASEVDVVTVARLIPKKGIDTLLRALPENATCEVVGDGPELDALKAIAGPSVTFRGALPHDEALDRIAHAKVFALPCRVAPDGDRDAMPTVIIEAMMRGVPVVSTTVVGIPEMVDDGVGRLVPPDDPDALRAALTALLEDEALNARLGEHASLHARQRFALDRQAGRLLALLEGIAR